MKYDFRKETIPVICGERSVKLLRIKDGRDGAVCFEPHWHERIEVIIIRTGCLELTVDDRSFSMLTDEIAVVAPCLLHSAHTGKCGVSYDVLMFDSSELKNLTIASKKYIAPLVSEQIAYTLPIKDAAAARIIDSLVEILESEPTEGSSLITVGRLYELLGILSRYSYERVPIVRDRKLSSVIEYISENFTSPLTTADLSRHFGYDEAYFCRRFKSATGIPVMKYLQTLRLENACKLIRQGVGIKRAAAESGFNDSGYFSRCFKILYNMTPAQYRDIYRNKN